MKVKRNFSYFFLFILILVVYVKIESVKCEMEPAIFRELTDLSMFQDNDLWRIRVDDTDRDLVITGPDVWQGNSDIFHTEGSVRVGHLWSQFLMLREGYWLTDRAESEGEYLIDFNVIQDRGKIIWYNGSWGFRDYFTTTAEHFVWIRNEYSYHLVDVGLQVLKDLDDIDAIWVELMNDNDPYSKIFCKTSQGLLEGNCDSNTGTHEWGSHTLNEEGWITFINPLKFQKGIPAFVLLQSSHEVHPVWYDSGTVIENIELHIIPPRESLSVNNGDTYSMQYMLVTGPDTDDHFWVEEAINQTRPILEIIQNHKLRKHSDLSIHASALDIVVNETVNISGELSPKISNCTLITEIIKPNDTEENIKVVTGIDGHYSLNISPSLVGHWKLFVSWRGNEEYYGSISDVLISVKEPPVVRGDINIFVFDYENNPVEDAFVKSIQNPGLPEQLSGKTDSSGRIGFPQVPFGDYVFNVTKEGFYENSTSIQFTPDPKAEYLIMLSNIPIPEPELGPEEGQTPEKTGGIPGYPYESILLGLIISLILLFLQNFNPTVIHRTTRGPFSRRT